MNTTDANGDITLKVVNIEKARDLDKIKLYFMYQDDTGFDGRKNTRYDLSTDDVEVSVVATHKCSSAHKVQILLKNRVYPASSQTTPS